MEGSGYQSAATGGAPSTIISSSEAPSFGSGATGTSWSSYDNALAEQVSSTAGASTAIPEEQEEEEEPASPDKPFDSSSKSGRPAPGTTRRTRATLVCAECKRLKLQCDRKRPHCSKCVGRGCTHLCTYSEASQGKIDLVALNNRLVVVEEKQQKFERERHDKAPSGGWTLPFAHIDREKETQELQRKTDSELLSEDTLLAVSRAHGATLAVHHSGSTELWFNDLNFSSSLVRGNGMQAHRTVLRPHRGQYNAISYLEFLQRHPQLLSTDSMPGSVRRSTSAVASPRDDLMSDDASVFSEDDDDDDAPKVEAKWVALLPPSLETRKIIFDELEVAQRFHDAPAINVRWMRNRVESMISWVERMASGNNGAGTTASASSSIRRKRVKKKNPIPTGIDEPAPTLSFFAAAAAAIAVGAQLYLQKHGSGGTEHDAAGATGGAGGANAAKGAAGSSSSGSSNATMMNFDARARSKSPLVPTAAYSPSGTTPPREDLGITDELHETLIHAAKLALHIHAEQSGHASYDADYIYALINHAHYLLQFEAKPRAAVSEKKLKGKGKRKAPAVPPDNGEDNNLISLPSMHPELPHVLGHLVIASRQMGLDHEGDALSNDVFTGFDRETRRRLWWEIIVLDWIVNSNLNKACLIHDNDHTTGLPTVLDESQPYETALSDLPKAKDKSALDSIAFFLMKCTFTKTMKAMKGSSPYHDDDNLDENVSHKERADETEEKIARITEWAASIPKKMQPENLYTAFADFNKEVSDPPQPPMSSLQPPNDSDMLVDSIPGMSRSLAHVKPSAKVIELASRLAQICVLSLRENHAKVKFYIPLVKAMPVTRHAASVDVGASKALGAMDPARLVIEVSQILVPALQYAIMAKFMKYSFGRFIFDAAVVLAHIAICAPANGPAVMGSIETAINLLSNAPRIRAFQGNIEQGKDSVLILTALLKKARAASDAHAARFTIGNKRKRGEEDSRPERPEPFIGTFHIPFIGAGVKCIGIRKVAGEIPEPEAHGVTHPRIQSEETQPPVASTSREDPPAKETSSQKSASLVESSSSSSSATKRRRTEGVTIRSRILDKPKRSDGEHRRSSTSSRRQSAAPLTSRPRADSTVSSPVTSAPQSVVSEPLPQPTYSLFETVQSSSSGPAPIQTSIRPISSSDIQPVASPTHYMRPPSSLSQQVSPSQSVDYGRPSFDSRRVVPSHQSSSQAQRNLPNFGGQYQQTFSQPLANSPLSQYGSPQSYQPPPLGHPEPHYPDSNMGVHPSQGVEGPTYHIPSPVHVSANPSYAPGNQMLGMHEQSMQGSSQQQYFHPSQVPPVHPPMLFDITQNHGEQQQQQQQQWMNSANAPPPGEWSGHSHQ